MNKDDLRVQRTRKALQIAFAELLNEKELQHITVRELAERAKVHRATFYSHFQDIYALYDDIENQTIEQFTNIMEHTPTHSYDEIYHVLIEFLLENRAFIHIIFDRSKNNNFHKRIASIIEDRYLQIWLYESPDTLIDDKVRYLITYHINGCLSIIERWAQNNFNEDKAQIYQMLHQVNTNFDTALS